MFETKFEVIPRLIEELDPGPELAAFLSAIDVRRLSGHDRIVVLQARQRMASHYQAQVYEGMAAVAEAIAEPDDVDTAVEWAAAEIRAALRLTRRAADAELAFALDLQRRLPGVWSLLATGDIDVRRARVIATGTEHLPIGLARSVADRVLAEAPRLTTGQLAARVRRLCIEVDPDHARDRYRHAVRGRRVHAEPTESGTAHLLGLDLPPDRVTAAVARVNGLARSLKTKGETRTMDQLRSDVFLDLLLGTASDGSGARGTVELRVDLETLAGLADHPGELAGYGPVIADIARRVAEQHRRARWRYTVTDAGTSQPVHHGATGRRPTAGERRDVEIHDATCVFPGCRMPATGCDLDHRTAFADGGRTAVANLSALCRHDHRIRHDAGWTYRPLPNGDHEWTSRLGHTYTAGGRPP